MLMKILFRLILVALSAAAEMAVGNDWLIVPGQRLGPITAKSTRTDLDRLFGKTNVQDQEVDTGNGEEPATVVYSSRPERALTVFWYKNRIIEVLICYPASTAPCKWHTEDGVTVGTSVEKLEALNSRAFQFVAWGSDFGGAIASWQGGTLAPLFGEGVNRKLGFALNYPQSANGSTLEQKEWEGSVIGPDNLLISSDDEAVQHLHPTVWRLNMVFSRR